MQKKQIRYTVKTKKQNDDVPNMKKSKLGTPLALEKQ